MDICGNCKDNRHHEFKCAACIDKMYVSLIVLLIIRIRENALRLKELEVKKLRYERLLDDVLRLEHYRIQEGVLQRQRKMLFEYQKHQFAQMYGMYENGIIFCIFSCLREKRGFSDE